MAMKTCYKRLKNLFRREPSFRNPYVYLKEEAIAEAQKKKKSGPGENSSKNFDTSSLSINESFFSTANTKNSFKLKRWRRNKVDGTFKSTKLCKKKSFTESIRKAFDRIKGTDMNDASLLDISFQEDTQFIPETSSPILSADRFTPKDQENRQYICESYHRNDKTSTDLAFMPYDITRNQVVDAQIEKTFGMKRDNEIAKERQRTYNLGDDKSDKSDNTEVFSSPKSPSPSNFQSVYSEGSELSTHCNTGVAGYKSSKVGTTSGCKKPTFNLVGVNTRASPKVELGEPRKDYERSRPISYLVHIYHPNGSFILPKGTTDTPEILEFRKIYHECYEKNAFPSSTCNKKRYTSLSDYGLQG